MTERWTPQRRGVLSRGRLPVGAAPTGRRPRSRTLAHSARMRGVEPAVVEDDNDTRDGPQLAVATCAQTLSGMTPETPGALASRARRAWRRWGAVIATGVFLLLLVAFLVRERA